ncbi:MAG: hypothetical protein OXG97_20300 [Candidatus Poribacteria bacterium]|nr:hypothetical protein [Candidatus Poribacteria bacterium]
MFLMTTFRRFIGFLITGSLLFFLIKPFVQTHTDLKKVAFQWQWIAISLSVLLFYRSVYTYPFAALISSITGKQISFRDAFTLFHLSNITRYLPGRIWGVVRLFSLSHRFGLSKTAVGSSLTLHVGIETALGGLIAMSLLFSDGMRQTATGVLETFSGDTLPWVLAVMVGLAGFVFLIPKLAHHAKAFLKTLMPLLKTSRLWGTVLASHSLLWLCQGLAFFLFLRSLAPVRWADAGVLTASYAFAWIVGFLSFLPPGGLGIREGLLGVLLAHYMPAKEAILVALLCRLWMLSAEMVLASIAFLINRRCDERHSSPQNH